MRSIRRLFLMGLISFYPYSAFSTNVPDGWFFGFTGLASAVKGVNFILPEAGERIINLSFRRRGFSTLTDPFGNVVFAVGGGAATQGGFRWCGFRLEGELMFNITPYKQIRVDGRWFKQGLQGINLPNVGPVPIFPYNMSGSVVFGAAFFNFVYDLYFTSDAQWIPYAGVGIGYSYIHNQYRINLQTVNPRTRANVTTQLFRFSDHQTVPMGQGIAGIAYQADDFFSIGLDYRYMVTQQIRLFNGRFITHTINLTFNHWFN